MRDVYITATASFLPNAPVDNDHIEAVLGQVGPRPSRAKRMVLRSNKIQTRHYAIDPKTGRATHTNAQLAAEAVRALGVDVREIDLLACGTSMADQVMPNHAVMVQGELKAPAVETVAPSGVCLSGVWAMKYAYSSLRAGLAARAVATGSEAASTILTAKNFEPELEARVAALETHPEIAFEKDFLRWMLSDGAGAVLLETAPLRGGLSFRIEWIDTLSYAGEMEPCMYCGAVKTEDGALEGWTGMTAERRAADSVMTVKQDVKLLNEHVIRYTVEKPLAAIAERRKLRPEDVDHYLPHYSSDFFRDRVHEGMRKVGFDVPQERWFTNLASKGNTGAASIYIMLDELARSGRVKPGETLLCYVPESGRFSAGYILLTAV